MWFSVLTETEREKMVVVEKNTSSVLAEILLVTKI
jgi:hypothetical protein